MYFSDVEYKDKTTHELQLLLAQEVIGSEQWNRISAILKQREAETKTVTEKTFCWSRIAGIAAILALAVSIASFLFSIYQTSGSR
jgi:hypothetical protein